MIARPTPAPEHVAAITEARYRINTATDRRRRDPHYCDDAWTVYAIACAAAGLRTPPPWQHWPAQEDGLDRRPVGSHNSTRSTGGNERNAR